MNIKFIKTEEDYQIALKKLEVIFDANSGTIENDKGDILGLMIDEFENNIIQLKHQIQLKQLKSELKN